MSTHTFIARDESGRQCRIQVRREDPATTSSMQSAGTQAPSLSYVMEDGSRVRRIDNDTFQVIGTGAYVTRVDA